MKLPLACAQCFFHPPDHAPRAQHFAFEPYSPRLSMNSNNICWSVSKGTIMLTWGKEVEYTWTWSFLIMKIALKKFKTELKIETPGSQCRCKNEAFEVRLRWFEVKTRQPGVTSGRKLRMWDSRGRDNSHWEGPKGELAQEQRHSLWYGNNKISFSRG